MFSATITAHHNLLSAVATRPSQFATSATIGGGNFIKRPMNNLHCILTRSFRRNAYSAIASGAMAVRRSSPFLSRNISVLSARNPLGTRNPSDHKLIAIKNNVMNSESRRTITVVSRLGKRKTCKAVLDRFRRVKGGYLKRWRSGMVKKQRKKSSWRKFRLRGSILVKRSTHLRTLNKMMYKY